MTDFERKNVRLLERLATSYGIDLRYRDTEGGWREADPSRVAQVLVALGADLPVSSGVEDERPGINGEEARLLAHALRTRQQELNGRLVAPVLVAWDGRPEALLVSVERRTADDLAKGGGRGKVRLTLASEEGSAVSSDIDLTQYRREFSAATPAETSTMSAPMTYVVPPGVWAGKGLPLGYHRLSVEVQGRRGEALVIAAPRRCAGPWWSEGGGGSATTAWGLFAPLYALRSDRDWGAGDLAELEVLAQRVAGAGGVAVATLPLLAAYLDIPYEPAPYRPVSRLFWNEFYLAPERVPGFGACEGALRLWRSPRLQERLAALRDGALVDYKETMSVKRAVLEESAAAFFACGAHRDDVAFRRFLETRPEAEHYAAFRQEVEEGGGDWREWQGSRSVPGTEHPAGRDDGRVAHGSATRVSPRQYHLYCQWQMEEQLAAVAAAPSAAGLFLDFPVGVHPGGYDTWRNRDLFVHGLSTGAPPDSFFASGQDWAFPPLHPDIARQTGHRYFAACLRHHMRHAEVLRIDHIMGLHRLYVIPRGSPATEGVYLRYPAEESYAVLALESQRSRTVVVGEDLGTVPPGVRSAMRSRGVMRTWVFQMALKSRGRVPVSGIPSRSVCSMNTHDMAPFAGFLLGRDIDMRLETGQVSAAEARRERMARDGLRTRLARFLLAGGTAENGAAKAGGGTLLRGALRHMLRSTGGMVLVSLEDLLQETEPQNLPGTGRERPNWRRKLRTGDEGARDAVARAGQWLSR